MGKLMLRAYANSLYAKSSAWTLTNVIPNKLGEKPSFEYTNTDHLQEDMIYSLPYSSTVIQSIKL